jgi:translation initiation factor IF-3
VFADNGRQVLASIIQALEDVAQPESHPKMFGKSLMMLLVPSTKEKKIKEKKSVHESQGEEP